MGEHDGGSLPHIALLHRLADVVQRHWPIDVDELAVLSEHIEELAKVLVRQDVSSELVRLGQRQGQHPVSWLPLSWPIMLPERMRARRAPSSGEARGTTIVATHGPIVAGPNAGTRITARHVNPTPPAAFALNSAKASTVLLCFCGARVCKGCNREKADGRQITHCIFALLLMASTQ
jgi:hypothetical protein